MSGDADMTLSTATQEEFLRALDEDPEFRQRVRQRVLSAELIEMPERLAELTQQVAAIARDLSEFKAQQAEFNARQAEFNAEQRQFNRRVENDLGILKGSVAIRATQDHFEIILDELGFDYVKWLTRHDLVAMMRGGDSADIAVGDRQSFYRADLVLEACDDAELTHYIAVEASYTADRRDTDRAVRNADFLARFTGYPAHAVIASVSNDHDVQSLVDEGTVLWHQLTDRDLQPE